ncbi:lipase [Diaporthe helianthi]|uniref:sn-1-specific diacylglycerol lipase n=1 Tax=Diaporthe helianthi TaxID=158607 RepID=A0A2P5IDE5_DIAHE|nr:lipase [Diaporthe helianthi]
MEGRMQNGSAVGPSAAAPDPLGLPVEPRDVIPSPPPGRTLLPAPVATAISLWTRSTSLALRVGTVIGGYGFGAAKATTLSSLELGRGIIEGILHRAGSESFSRSNSDLGRADAETVMERSLESLHIAMSQVVFWTTAGFNLTSTTLSAFSEVSQLTLSYLDSILGSTESSRAIASIITLIRREFNNPATGQPGEHVGVFDLIVGMVGLAYFQRWSWRLIMQESQRLQVDEVLWDVVIINDEERLDYGRVDNGRQAAGHGMEGGSNEMVIQTIQQHDTTDSSDGESDLPEIRLKHQIMRTLPAGAKVSIVTETKTTKTITVDVSGTQPSALAPPAGVELVEETRLRPVSSQGNRRLSVSSDLLQGSSPLDSTYRVVYRVNKNTLRSAEMEGGPEEVEVPRFVEQIDSDAEQAIDQPTISDDEKDVLPPSPTSPTTPPPPPPKSPRHESQTEPFPLAVEAQPVGSRSRKGRISPALSRKSSVDKTSEIPLPKQSPETSANQKRPRMPVSPPGSTSSIEAPRKKQQSMSKLLSKRQKGDIAPPSSAKPPSEKKGGLRNVLKRGSGTNLSTTATKDGKDSVTSNPSSMAPKGKQQPMRDLLRGPAQANQKPSSSAAKKQLSVPNRDSSLVPRREAPRPPQGGQARNPLSSRALAEYEASGAVPRSPSRASYISIHEHRRDSLISQTDTFSIHSVEHHLRPVSPTYKRSPIAKSKSDRDIVDRQLPPPSPSRHHRRVNSQTYSPSIYTLKTAGSQMSLIPFHHRSPFGDAEALHTLRRRGSIDTTFPRFHLLRNITRYMRFSSASYGSSFLKVFGITKTMPPMLKALDDTHHELRIFAHHTQSQPQSILLSSFVDTQGGSDSSGATETGVPLVHYVSLDDESKAVVLACRGTLGFEDVLADMTCDYDDLVWRGKSYKVHKGIHASAKRLLYGGDGRVLVTIKAALEENPDYGLVLCGHSLGGAVTALLGVMLSEPIDGGTSFVTSDEPHSRLLTYPSSSSADAPAGQEQVKPHICLPAGRPIHVYAYGPPATMSPSLRIATRGLITSVVHGQDLVPYLSLGVLHDFQAMALAFKTDNADAKQEIKQRVWEALQGGLMDKWRGSGANKSRDPVTNEDEEWAFAAFKTLRASMMSEKLLPPGEVFVVETEKVLRRDAFVGPDGSGQGQQHQQDGSSRGDNDNNKGQQQQQQQNSFKYVGRPARRIVLKYVRDVETRFREVRFGATMLTDHNPAKYEDALDGLRFGVVES